MLGETDPSHIIRSIEYWDNEKRKYPQRQNFAEGKETKIYRQTVTTPAITSIISSPIQIYKSTELPAL